MRLVVPMISCDNMPTKTHNLHPFPHSFVPHVLFEIPGNLFLKRFRPHVWRKSN